MEPSIHICFRVLNVAILGFLFYHFRPLLFHLRSCNFGNEPHDRATGNWGSVTFQDPFRTLSGVLGLVSTLVTAH